MLQSADIAAKLLSGNTLTSRKVHLVGAAGHEVPAILWPNPQFSIKQPLNFLSPDNQLGIGMARQRNLEVVR
jgi:hypothetical protein